LSWASSTLRLTAIAVHLAEHLFKVVNAARQSLRQAIQSPPLVPSSKPDSTERLLLQLETITMEMISVARVNDLEMLHERAKVQLEIVEQLQIESTWPTERILSFLKNRRRFDPDGPDFEEMRRKVQEAECVHGLLAG
jgi:hypothetical protein